MPDDLHEALQTGPFHVALRAAIEARGLSLDRLRHRLERRGLRVGVTSLSYWQQGLRRPERAESLLAVAALEEILTLPPRSLSSLLGPPRPRGRNTGLPPGAVGYAAILPRADALAVLLEQLDGVADDRRLHIAGMYETVRIGRDRGLERRETVQVVQAHEDAADRYIMVYRGDPGCDVERVRVTALEDCRVGRVRRDPAAELLVAELLFDRTLRIGETQVLRYELTDRGGAEVCDYERGFRFPAGHYVLRVGFDPAELPVRIRRYSRRSGGQRASVDLTLNAHHAVHLATDAIQPGLVGFCWEWG
ncbi:hypothetical protein ACIBG8_14255 [Nonomuraea sp. NPDC050556]|uniref:hypothetical protein n=1 Tax=Nonomuraea sp. NPDC050556 TaxID=3364369 RepID=UPI00379BF08F